MNNSLLTWTLVVFGFICGAFADQSVEKTNGQRAAAALAAQSAAHAHDVATVIGVQHCDDVVVGFLVIDKSGAITPHFEPGQTDESVNKIMNAAPQHAALRVCTEREQRWD